MFSILKKSVSFVLIIILCFNNICYSNVIGATNQFSKKNPKKTINFYNLVYDSNLLHTLKSFGMNIIEVGENQTIKKIQDAVSVANDNTIIFVYNGIYRESVKAGNKKLHIIGEDVNKTLIFYNSNDYENPPIEMSKGSIQNITIQSMKNDLLYKNYYAAAYNIHIDDNNSFNEELLVRNCSFMNDNNASIGIGLHEGQRLFIYDCYINGSIYLHNEYFFMNLLGAEKNKQLFNIKNTKIDGGIVFHLFDRVGQNVELNINNVNVSTGIYYLDEGRNAIIDTNSINWPKGVTVNIN